MPEAPPFKVCARAPLRVALAGGGSDLLGFVSPQGGAEVVAALSLAVQVEIRLGGGTIRLRAEDRQRQVTLRSPADLTYDGTLDAPKAALNMLPVTGGVEILTRSDAPAGAGLGERGALNVALLAALSLCRNQRQDATELAELAFHLETAELGRPAGRADPYAAALGGVQHLTFRGEVVSARALELDDHRLADLAAYLVIVCPARPYGAEGASHRLLDAIAGGETSVLEALTALRELTGSVVEGVEQGNWRRVAELFANAAGHHATLDPVWSSPPARALRDAVAAAGAWGMTPAGPRPGGSLVVLAPPDCRDAVTRAARAHGGVVLETAVGAPGATVWREPLAEA